ncbi:hypothetical protein ES708_26176 [subsurface metagenome]
MVSLNRALYLDPDFVLAHFTLGNIMRQKGKIKESGRHFKNASLILKNHTQSYLLPESENVTAGRLSEIISYMSE